MLTVLVIAEKTRAREQRRADCIDLFRDVFAGAFLRAFAQQRAVELASPR